MKAPKSIDEFENILSSIPQDTYSETTEKLKALRTNEPSLLNMNIDGLEMLLQSFVQIIEGYNYESAKKLVAESAVTFAKTKHHQLEESSILLGRYFDKLMVQFEPAFFNYKSRNDKAVPFERILIFSIYSEIKILAFESVAFQKNSLYFLGQGDPEKTIECLQTATAIADYIPSQIDRSEKEKMYLYFSGFKDHVKGTMSILQGSIKLDSYDFSYFSDTRNRPEGLFEKALGNYMEGQSVSSDEVFNVDFDEVISGLRLESLSLKLNNEIGEVMYLLLLSENKKIKLNMHVLESVHKKGEALALASNKVMYVNIFKILKLRIDNIRSFVINEKELIDKIREQPQYIREIKGMIARGKLDLDRMSDIMPELLLEIDYRDEFTLLRNKYSRNEKEHRVGIITDDEYRIVYDKIVRSILSVLNEIELNR